MCGEKYRCCMRETQPQGSPPRVRGKVLCIFFQGCFSGITPACAGKRLLLIRPDTRFGDHPRVCGEKNIWEAADTKSTGSPPRVRGKGWQPVPRTGTRRITPACAGKRLLLMRPDTRFGDHPRVCGEKRFNRDQTILTTGSPPRVRGKVVLFATRTAPKKDHPRVCGEK